MIQLIDEVPDNMVAFRATGEVTKADFEEIVLPAVEALIGRQDDLNYLLELDTSVKNFTPGAWWQDAILGLKALRNWNRAAIITDSTGIQTFTSIFSKVMPGEFRGFAKEDLQKAIDWVSGND